MKVLHKFAIALLIAAPAAGATVQADQQHQQHHPQAAAAPVAPAPTAQPSKDMAAQMESMREMHERMHAAKTPAERKALMAEHMKAMKGGMATLSASSDDAASRCEREGGARMEQRMQMMEMMLQMMMDRMPAEPN